MALLQTGLQYKRSKHSPRPTLRELPEDWGKDGIRTAGRATSENITQMDVWCWFKGECVAIYRSGVITGGL